MNAPPRPAPDPGPAAFPEPPPERRALLAGRVLLALCLGAAGGAVASRFNLPLAWMIGAMVVTTVASAGGLPLTVPAWLRSAMIAVLGVMLGSAFSPDLPGEVARWLPSLAALPLYGVLTAALLWLYFRRIAGYDPVTAWFSGVPGGLSEMVVVGSAEGGDERTISLIHASRVLLVVSTLPLWFIFTEGYVRQDPVAATEGLLDIPAPDLLLLAACIPVGMAGARLLRIPAARLTGPMILSAAVHLAGLTAWAPPGELVAIAQVVVGSAIGARFAGIGFRRILHTLVAASGATILMLLVTVAFAVALGALTGLPAPLLLLAFAPGGLAEMSLIALALGVDAAFVSTHHILRIGLLVILGPLLFRAIRPWLTGAPRPSKNR